MKTDNTKTCSQCNKTKDIIDFYPKCAACKDCINKEQKLYRDRNKGNDGLTRLRECSECGLTKDLEVFKKNLNGYYRKYCKECYEKFPDSIHCEDLRRRINHRKSDAIYKDRVRTPEFLLYMSAKGRAKKLGLKFNIKISDIIIPEFCPILGVKLESGNGKVQSCSPTLDRIIPSNGYTQGNIRVISARANGMKSNLNNILLYKILSYVEDGTIHDYMI